MKRVVLLIGMLMFSFASVIGAKYIFVTCKSTLPQKAPAKKVVEKIEEKAVDASTDKKAPEKKASEKAKG